MSTKIKHKVGQFYLNRKLKKLKRKVRSHNFTTAKTAGIIFNAPDKKSFEAIKKFLSFLSDNNLKVIALGYIPAQKIPEEFLMWNSVNFYCNTDLNWYYKPKNVIINEFINQSFDILFDLSIDEYFTTNFIGNLSKANFKIGKQRPNSYHDLVIDINKNNSIKYLIDQIRHYLNLI